jgi:drug/metabolite transporter (DMT)-like permease
MEPAFTAVTAYIFLAERLTTIQAIGGIFTLSGVVFLRMFENKQLNSSAKRPLVPVSTQEE